MQLDNRVPNLYPQLDLPPLKDRLKNVLKEAEKKISIIKETIAVLDKNPDMGKLIDLLGKISL